LLILIRYLFSIIFIGVTCRNRRCQQIRLRILYSFLFLDSQCWNLMQYRLSHLSRIPYMISHHLQHHFCRIILHTRYIIIYIFSILQLLIALTTCQLEFMIIRFFIAIATMNWKRHRINLSLSISFHSINSVFHHHQEWFIIVMYHYYLLSNKCYTIKTVYYKRISVKIMFLITISYICRFLWCITEYNIFCSWRSILTIQSRIIIYRTTLYLTLMSKVCFKSSRLFYHISSNSHSFLGIHSMNIITSNCIISIEVITIQVIYYILILFLFLKC